MNIDQLENLTGGARNGDPATSHEAASNDFTAVALIVHAAIEKQGSHGATWGEIEDATGIARQTISPRFVQLRRADMIRDSGQKRKGKSGRMQIVWVATTPQEIATIRNNTREDREAKAKKIILRACKQLKGLNLEAFIEGWTFDAEELVKGVFFYEQENV